MQLTSFSQPAHSSGTSLSFRVFRNPKWWAHRNLSGLALSPLLSCELVLLVIPLLLFAFFRSILGFTFSFCLLVMYSAKSTIMAISMAMSIMEMSKDSVSCHRLIKAYVAFIELMNRESLFLTRVLCVHNNNTVCGCWSLLTISLFNDDQSIF